MTRYSITVGRFTVTDFFDNNAFSHDPRTQFMGWAVMYNGAWDYPADTRGYTWGWVHEFHTKRWSVRYGSAAEPQVANGLRFDRRILSDRGDMVEGERRWRSEGPCRRHPVLSSLLHTDSGSYAEALALNAPDRSASRCYRDPAGRPSEVWRGNQRGSGSRQDIGVFGRLGWNDGKTESFAFTAIDRLATGGVSVKGARWKRPHDVAASEAHSRAASQRRARAVSRAWRLRLSDRRRRAALWHGEYLGKLLQRQVMLQFLCGTRSAIYRQPGLQSGPWAGVGS